MAGNTRFHNKYHFAQHHSEKTTKNEKYPEATTDPIASEDFPFQGQFHSDGVLKIHPTDPDQINEIHNNVTLHDNLTVEKDTLIKGGLEVVGNVLLRADPFSGDRIIEIGNDKEGGEFDIVRFRAYIDSHFSPDHDNQHDLGEPGHFWRRVYTDSLTLSSELMVGDCEDQPFRGMYINNALHKPAGARLGINTCEPQQELHVVGDTIITETLNVKKDIVGEEDLWIYKNADIDGVLTLKNDKAIRWENDFNRIYNTTDKLIIDVEKILQVNAPTIDLSTQSVKVDLKEAVDAICFEEGIFGIDALNRRVGVNTCAPTKPFHVIGDTLITGGEIDIKASDKVRIEGANRLDLYSEKNVHIESDEESSWVAGDKITIATPEIVAIAANMDWDLAIVDMTTQPVQFKLRDSSTRALQFGTCLLNLDALNQHVGINTCDPISGLHVKGGAEIEDGITTTGDVKMTGDDSYSKFKKWELEAEDVIIKSTKTVFNPGNVGIGVDDPLLKLSLPCGESVGTKETQGATTIDNKITFCVGFNNSEGWDDMLVETAGRADLRIEPGRSTKMSKPLSIGRPFNDDFPESELEVRGRIHALGDIIIESSENNGKGKDTISIHSYEDIDIGTITTRSGLIGGGDQNNLVVDLNTLPQDPTDLQPGFGIRYNDTTGNKQVGLIYSSYLNSSNTVDGFLGVNTNEHIYVDAVNRGGDGLNQPTNLNVKGYAVVQGDMLVDDNLHVNNDQVVDGRVDINCTGTDLQSDPNGLRILRGSLFITNDNTEDAKMILDTNVSKLPKAGADDLGSGSNTVSNLAGGQKEHLALDLRNTADETTFAVRYSGSNDGIADKIGLAMRPYSGEAHLGIGGIPSQNEHLHVYGNTKITGNLTVDGTNTIINTANLEIEDAHITLNKSQNQNSTTNNLLSGGLWFQGDNNEIVGYVRVHDTDLSKLVAKAPTGQVLEFDINGDQLSRIQLDESVLDIEHTNITTNDSNVTIDNAVVDIDANLTVEAASFVDQDLTRDSTDVEFGDLNLTTSLNIPVGAYGNPSAIADPNLDDGFIRYNEDTDSYEASKNGLWLPIDKSHIIKDRDGDTFIEVHEDDDDTITTKVKDDQKMFIDENGIQITAPITIDSGDRKLPPAIRYTQSFTTADIQTMPGNFTVRGLGSDATEPPVATGVEMTAGEIVAGNNYVIIDHRTDRSDAVVQVYTNTGKMMIPDEIHIINSNRICVDVTSFDNLAGKVVISL